MTMISIMGDSTISTERILKLLIFLFMCKILHCMDINENETDKNVSQVEISALFIDCNINKDDDPELRRLQREELYKYDALDGCGKKLALTLKMIAKHYDSGEEYIPIDHVFDGPSRKRVRLLDPYVLRIRRSPPMQAYKLRHTGDVKVLLVSGNEGSEPWSLNHKVDVKAQDKLIRKRRSWTNYGGVSSCASYSPLTLIHDDPGRRSYSVRINDTIKRQDSPASTLFATDDDEKSRYAQIFSKRYKRHEYNLVVEESPDDLKLWPPTPPSASAEFNKLDAFTNNSDYKENVLFSTNPENSIRSTNDDVDNVDTNEFDFGAVKSGPIPLENNQNNVYVTKRSEQINNNKLLKSGRDDMANKLNIGTRFEKTMNTIPSILKEIDKNILESEYDLGVINYGSKRIDDVVKRGNSDFEQLDLKNAAKVDKSNRFGFNYENNVKPNLKNIDNVDKTENVGSNYNNNLNLGLNDINNSSPKKSDVIEKKYNIQSSHDTNINLDSKHFNNFDKNINYPPNFENNINSLPIPIDENDRQGQSQHSAPLYSLFEVGNPDLWHTLQMQILQKSTDDMGKTVWSDITFDKKINVGISCPDWTSNDVTVRYRMAGWLNESQFVLPDIGLSLLKKLSGSIHDQSSGLTKNDYIIVPSEDIMLLDNDLNKYEESRLNVRSEKGSKNDKGSRQVVVRVNRAVGDNRVSMSVVTHGSDYYLTVPHLTPLQVQLDVEARADTNELIHVGTMARISMVVADSTRRTRSILTMHVTNTGLAASRFRAIVRDCEPKFPTLVRNARNDVAATTASMLPPRHTKRMVLSLPVELPANMVHCSVALVNNNGETVAVRDVSIKKMDRCFCVWHCNCVCLEDDPNLMCNEMSAPKQIAAGISLKDRPRRQCSEVNYYTDEPCTNFIVILFGLFLFLLALGLLKALVGNAIRPVGMYGLCRLVKLPRQVDHYYEPWLCMRRVVHDSDGWPLHPDTKQRTVRTMSMSMEFLLNLMFFIIFPIVVMRDGFKGCKDTTTVPLTQEKEPKKKNFFSRLSSSNKPKYEKVKIEVKKRPKNKKQEKTNDQVDECEPEKPRSDGALKKPDKKRDKREKKVKNISLCLERRLRKLRQWMSPEAEDLSGELWSETNELRNDELIQKCSACMDSDDDTKYVVSQMEKSRESLAWNNMICFAAVIHMTDDGMTAIQHQSASYHALWTAKVKRDPDRLT